MEQCFNCGKPYDETHPDIVCTIFSKNDRKELPLRAIADSFGTLALCPICARAVAIGTVLNCTSSFEPVLKDFKYKYERGGNL